MPQLFLVTLVLSLVGGVLVATVPAIARRRRLVLGAGAGLMLIGLLGVSIVEVPAGSVGHVTRVVAGRPLGAGQVVALPGQKGPQADTLGPGLHLKPLFALAHTVEIYPLVSVPQGQYGLLVAKDGAPLSDDQFLAAAWPPAEERKMLEAAYFLAHGGQRGAQLTVLKPGQYRLNRYLFDVSLHEALDVGAGSVAVIKSNVQEADRCPERQPQEAVGLVPRGCVGVWEHPLMPGRYYLNRAAYDVTTLPTRVVPLSYRGGYLGRAIELRLDEGGRVLEVASESAVPVPVGASGEAFVVNVEGWKIPIDLDLAIQIDAEGAPALVASAGDVANLEASLLRPFLRNVVRDSLEGADRTVLDLVTKRADLEREIEGRVRTYATSIGLEVPLLKLGEPALPPETLVALQRQDLAGRLAATYASERQAQEARVTVEKTRALADQQPRLVEAELAVQIAELDKQALRKRGEGERLRFEELAGVLSREEMLQLAVTQETLSLLRDNPDIIKVPTVLVQGEGGLSGPAAVLGVSQLLGSGRLGASPTVGRSEGGDAGSLLGLSLP